MYRTIKYTLIDGVTITTEGPVCFPQTLNPCMDFMQAVSVLEAGGEVRRASIYRQNTDCGPIKSSRGGGSSLPAYSEYWLNTGDGYIPYTMSATDKLARDWVITAPPPPMRFSQVGNYTTAEEIPSLLPHLLGIDEEYIAKNPEPDF